MKRPKKRLPRPKKSADETRAIIARLETLHPNAFTELHFTNPFELLVATILSAQSTDQRVNQVTPQVFRRFPDAAALARADREELEQMIVPTGFFRMKSRALLGMAQALVDRHSGQVPPNINDLVRLPGVGRKTANVVLGHALGVAGLPVDRHVLRVANRIGIARSEDPEIVEQQLCGALPAELWIVASDTLILHGRRICRPRPLCERCVVAPDCDYYRLVVSRKRPAGSRERTKAAREVVRRRTGAGSAGSRVRTDGRAGGKQK